VSLAFEYPWYLALLLLTPVVWIWGYRSLANLGGLRRAIVLALRTAVIVLVPYTARLLKAKQQAGKQFPGRS
jgi:hypothetical protein